MEGTVDAQLSSLIEEEFNALIGDYSIPNATEFGQDSILTRSQYAKVIFHDIADTYPTDADICCRYSLTGGVTVSHGDRVALYRVGWSSVQAHIVFDWVPVTDATELKVLFKASSLPKDEEEFYQLCYVTINDEVCGASVPFQFRHPHENELCAVEEPGGMVVVRSRTAFNEEKLRRAFEANEMLKKEKGNLQKELKIFEEKCSKVSEKILVVMEKLTKLETEKQVLEKRLEDNMHMERHVERLQKDLLALDAEKNQCLSKLNKAEQHIEVLAVTVDTLSSDKDHMAQLLRSETQNKSGVVAEISQYRCQVDSLTHMLEALTQSKELVAQELRVQQATNIELREDIRRLESESREQRNKIAELQNEKKLLQEFLEQSLSAEKDSEERIRQINGLEKEKECLLSELVQSASKREKEIKMMTEVYELRLKEVANKAMIIERDLCTSKAEAEETKKDVMEAAQVNKCLKQQLEEAHSIISEKGQNLTQIILEKSALEAELKKAVEAQKKSLEHNERLATRLMELENESAPLRLQLQEQNVQKERHACFREVFTDLEHRIANLEVSQEEVAANKNVQLERIDAIAERLSELDIEEGKLHCERQDVAAIRDTQEDKLARTTKNLTSLEERLRKDYLMESDQWLHVEPDTDTLRETVNELTLFVESSKMRISEIDQRMKEIEEEKFVLMQQQSHALERKNECEKHGEEVHLELAELQEREREIVREQAGQLATLQDQLDHALNQNSEMLATGLTLEEKLALAKKEKAELQYKLEESISSQEQQCSSINATEVNSCLEQEQQLKLRLQLAAAEYRKLYTEKQKVERRLAKLYHKLSEKKAKSSSSLEQSEAREQPATAELISLSSQASGFSSETDMVMPSQERGSSNFCSVCPICSVTFPPGAYDLFTQHFDAHLS